MYDTTMQDLMQHISQYTIVVFVVYAFILAFALIPIVGSAISLYHAVKDHNTGLIVISSIGLLCGCLTLLLPILVLPALIFMFISLALDNQHRKIYLYVIGVVLVLIATITAGILFIHKMQDDIKEAAGEPADTPAPTAEAVPNTIEYVWHSRYSHGLMIPLIRASYENYFPEEAVENGDQYVIIKQITMKITDDDPDYLSRVSSGEYDDLVTAELISIYSQYTLDEIKLGHEAIGDTVAKQLRDKFHFDELTAEILWDYSASSDEPEECFYNTNKTESYTLPDLTITTKRADGDTKDSYCIIGITLSINKEHDDYGKYGGDAMAGYADHINSEVISVISQYTVDEIKLSQDAICDEILKRIQQKFGSDVIFDVSISNIMFG